MKNLAIIPARAGSKGLKDKNIRPLDGKPLIQYSIEAALNSGVFAEVMLSTDSPHYADIAVQCGARCPYLRPPELASDTASTWDVVREIIHHYRNQGTEFDTLTVLQPTSPCRTAEDIRNGYRLLSERNANAIVSVTETPHPAQWTIPLPEDGSLEELSRRLEQKSRRQSFSKSYCLNGALYICRVDYILNASNIFWKNCFAYVMPKERSFDVDDIYDFEICRVMLEMARKNDKGGLA